MDISIVGQGICSQFVAVRTCSITLVVILPVRMAGKYVVAIILGEQKQVTCPLLTYTTKALMLDVMVSDYDCMASLHFIMACS